MQKDALGDRMKNYEQIFRQKLLPKSYTIIRVDGRSFSKFTSRMKFERPFDKNFTDSMDYAATRLLELQNVVLSYVQSDEITLVMTDFESVETQQAFGGRVDKLLSITASTASVAFVKKLYTLTGTFAEIQFDSRIFQVPTHSEACNAVLWRIQDAAKNSVGMYADSVFSHKQLEGVPTGQRKKMLLEQGINWEEVSPKLKYGRLWTNLLEPVELVGDWKECFKILSGIIPKRNL